MDIRSLWNSGCSLEEALARFGDDAEWQRHDELADALKTPEHFFETGMKRLAEASGESPPINPGPPGEQLPIVQMAYMLAAGANMLWGRNGVERSVAQKLQDGELLGIGYELPRRTGDVPTLIPSDVWGGKIDWKVSAASGNGLEFVSVRVILAKQEEAMRRETMALLPAPEEKIVGRPPVKRFVLEAYEALKASGAVDFGKPKRFLYAQIRTWLGARYPDRQGQLEGLSDETVRIVVSGLFDEDKAAKKQ